MTYTPNSTSLGHQLSNYYSIIPNNWIQTPFLCMAKGFCRNDIMIWALESTRESAAKYLNRTGKFATIFRRFSLLKPSFRVRRAASCSEVSAFKAQQTLHYTSSAPPRSHAKRLTRQFPPAAAGVWSSVCWWLWWLGSIRTKAAPRRRIDTLLPAALFTHWRSSIGCRKEPKRPKLRADN